MSKISSLLDNGDFCSRASCRGPGAALKLFTPCICYTSPGSELLASWAQVSPGAEAGATPCLNVHTKGERPSSEHCA